MTKKITFYIFLFFCFILNIVLDFNVKKYIELLEKCFEKNITLTANLHMLICSIIALISILILLDILLVFYKKQMQQVLGFNEVPGIVLGKYNGNIVKLPFQSYFNKNICVFGSSRKYENNRISNY